MERAPPLAACINCGTPLSPDARYCSRCGQDRRYTKLRLGELIGDATQELLALDRPWVATLRGMFPEVGTLSRRYVEGHRANLVGPMRFLLIALAVELVVSEIASRTGVVTAPSHRSAFTVSLLAFTLVLAWLLRATCGARQHDLAEPLVLACYAVGITALAIAGWMYGLGAIALPMLPPASAALGVFVGMTFVFFVIVIPVYWAWSIARFFACSWWRSLAVAYLAGTIGALGVVALKLHPAW